MLYTACLKQMYTNCLALQLTLVIFLLTDTAAEQVKAGQPAWDRVTECVLQQRERVLGV